MKLSCKSSEDVREGDRFFYHPFSWECVGRPVKENLQVFIPVVRLVNYSAIEFKFSLGEEIRLLMIPYGYDLYVISTESSKPVNYYADVEYR
jgi:hypothetical protein